MRDYHKVNKKLLDFVSVVSDPQSPEYLHTKEIVEEDGIDFLAVKCQPELSDFFGTLCFATSFLPLLSDFEGEKRIIPVSCEGDFFASFSGYVLFPLSGKPPLFADFIM